MIGGQGTRGNGHKLTFGTVLEAGEFISAVLDRKPRSWAA
jgi:hypothetical protein